MERRLKQAFILFITFFGIVLFNGIAAAASFSADVLSTVGKETSRGKIYISGQKMRFETGGTVSITRMDKKVVWLLIPSEKTYMEQAIRLQNVVPGQEPSPDEVSRTFLGNERVNGYDCAKYRVVVRVDNQRQPFLEWTALDSGVPVKIATEDGRWAQEYSNIRLGGQDWALFEIPANYEKFGMSLW